MSTGHKILLIEDDPAPLTSSRRTGLRSGAGREEEEN